ncbi:MAG: T9SS type A sorting domain-containing protein [Bacteroidetes bacterium]|nr:T9SS type A sorting domain-containing protein [Bacteroidota bacterium]MCW5894386.1 T9SS type A sorting domain-containing protein [Bacteroidota bacterium]
MHSYIRFFVVAAAFAGLLTATAQPAVYPLHKGDRWQYTLVPMTARIDKDSLMPNGQRYALIKYEFSRADRWERTSGNRVYWYNPQTNEEHVWYDFSLAPGDTVTIIPRTNDSTIIYFVSTGTYDLFGAARRWWSFWVDHVTSIIDEEEWITITDSIGMTHISAMWYTSSIMGAIINGMQYGTIVHAGEHSVIPRGFHLHQNFPNPFNPGTEIRYQMPEVRHVTLKVFDVLGREVATLVNEVKPPGEYSVQFDGSNLSSGVYFYRLQTESFEETKKLLLAR